MGPKGLTKECTPSIQKVLGSNPSCLDPEFFPTNLFLTVSANKKNNILY